MTGRDIAKHFEGLRCKAYRDPVGILTIGYGHTKGVKEGMIISPTHAEELFEGDWLVARGQTLRLCPRVGGNRLDALIDFTFNLGSGRLAASTLRRLVNRGDWLGAEKEFSKWVFGGGRKLPGLILRRAAEQELFNLPESLPGNLE